MFDGSTIVATLGSVALKVTEIGVTTASFASTVKTSNVPASQSESSSISRVNVSGSTWPTNSMSRFLNESCPAEANVTGTTRTDAARAEATSRRRIIVGSS